MKNPIDIQHPKNIKEILIYDRLCFDPVVFKVITKEKFFIKDGRIYTYKTKEQISKEAVVFDNKYIVFQFSKDNEPYFSLFYIDLVTPNSYVVREIKDGVLSNGTILSKQGVIKALFEPGEIQVVVAARNEIIKLNITRFFSYTNLKIIQIEGIKLNKPIYKLRVKDPRWFKEEFMRGEIFYEYKHGEYLFSKDDYIRYAIDITNGMVWYAVGKPQTPIFEWDHLPRSVLKRTGYLKCCLEKGGDYGGD